MTKEEALNIQIGDRVLVKGGLFVTKDGSVPESELLVVAAGEIEREQDSIYWISTGKVSIKCIQRWPNDFTKVEDKYFAGLGVGISAVDPVQPPFRVNTEVTARAEPLRTPVVTLPHVVVAPTPQLGVYRPNLEDRKVGKVPMHMVTDGFPNALKAVAEVMAWAAAAKGYKLHDWRNLPNAATELPAAEYRHSNENAIQKSEGLKALERIDHESNKLHIAHKVFNALAELELVLCGKIE